MSIDAARARYEAEAPKVVELQLEEIEARPDLDRTTAAAPVAVDTFVAALTSTAALSAERPRQVVRSIDAGAQIAAPTAVASPPPGLPSGSAGLLSPGRIIRKN